MAMELMMSYNGNESFTTKAEENAVQEAASGLESIEKLIKLLSETGQQYNSSSSSFSAKLPSMEIKRDYNAVADIAISKFKRVISLLDRNRTGHARFRRAPLPLQQNQTSQTQIQTQPKLDVIVFNTTPLQHIPLTTTTNTAPIYHHKSGTIQQKNSSKILNLSYLSAADSFTSSLTGDTNTKQRTSSSPGTFQITNLSQVSSSGKPPLSSSFKRKCSSETLGSGNYGSSSSHCHCPKKRRKLTLKRVVRVPAISLNIADIPPDDYSWRKYGQKSIKGSPHPRGYYRCSSVKECPAHKRVERALDDPSMLIVTYEGEHDHSLSAADPTNLLL